MLLTILQPQLTSALHCEAPVRAQTRISRHIRIISKFTDHRNAADSAVQRWCKVPLHVQNGEACIVPNILLQHPPSVVQYLHEDSHGRVRNAIAYFTEIQQTQGCLTGTGAYPV